MDIEEDDGDIRSDIERGDLTDDDMSVGDIIDEVEDDFASSGKK